MEHHPVEIDHNGVADGTGEGRMTAAQWFHDDDFDVPLPEWLSDDIRRFYGIGPHAVDFAQALAAYLSARHLKIEGPA